MSAALRIAPASLVVLALAGWAGTGAVSPGAAAQAPAVRRDARLEGRLVLLERGRPARESGLDLGQSAVWFEPERQGRAGATLAPIAAEMTTTRKQFSPRLLVVPVGSTVRFPNQDPILHNVFSVSAGNRFDLGLLGTGTGKVATFRAPGIVQVFCNVHHAMFAHVVVVGTPHYARPDERGSFALAGLPEGPGTLHFWHERGAPMSRPVTLPHAAPVTLELPLTLPRVPPHKNKLGRTYSRDAYE